MNINHCLSSMECTINLAKKEGERTWLKSDPHPLLIVDVRQTELGVTQVLISGFQGKVWLNLLDSDIVFNAFEKNGSPLTLKELFQLAYKKSLADLREQKRKYDHAMNEISLAINVRLNGSYLNADLIYYQDKNL